MFDHILVFLIYFAQLFPSFHFFREEAAAAPAALVAAAAVIVSPFEFVCYVGSCDRTAHQKTVGAERPHKAAVRGNLAISILVLKLYT